MSTSRAETVFEDCHWHRHCQLQDERNHQQKQRMLVSSLKYFWHIHEWHNERGTDNSKMPVAVGPADCVLLTKGIGGRASSSSCRRAPPRMSLLLGAKTCREFMKDTPERFSGPRISGGNR